MARLLALVALLVLGAVQASSAAETASPWLEGQFLVAEPELGDPRFRDSVILVIAHNAEGAVGVIVNKPFGHGDVAALLRGLGIDAGPATEGAPLHYGGPVEPAALFVLHSEDYRGPTTQHVAEGVGLTMRPDVLRALGRGEGPQHFLVALGYAGWAPGQLEREFDRGDWSSAPGDAGLLFEVAPADRWDEARSRAGLRL